MVHVLGLRGRDRPRGRVVTETWRAQAACRDMPTAMFFPPANLRAELAAALAVCKPCPVKGECLRDALTIEAALDDGVRGGTTARARSRMPRTKRPPVLPNHGTTARYHRGCKCSLCMAAHTEYQRQYHINRKLRTA